MPLDDNENKWVMWICDYTQKMNRSTVWQLVENKEEVGKIYSIPEFKNIAWYYCPGISGYGTGDKVSWDAGVVTAHVEIIQQVVSSQAIVRFDRIGTFTIKVNGKEKTIDVYEEVRNCLKN
jgi:hypothetical protein